MIPHMSLKDHRKAHRSPISALPRAGQVCFGVQTTTAITLNGFADVGKQGGAHHATNASFHNFKLAVATRKPSAAIQGESLDGAQSGCARLAVFLEIHRGIGRFLSRLQEALKRADVL